LCIHQSSFLRTVLEEIFDFISEKKLVTDEVSCYEREKGNGNKYFYSTFQFNIKKNRFHISNEHSVSESILADTSFGSRITHFHSLFVSNVQWRPVSLR